MSDMELELDEWGLLPSDYDRDEIGDTTSGRMNGITRVKRAIAAIGPEKARLEKLAKLQALADAQRREAEEKARALEHYEEVGFGSWG